MVFTIRLLLLVFCLVLAPSFSFSQEKAASSQEKFLDESYVYLLMERQVELKKDWTTKEMIHQTVRIQKEEAKDLGEIPIHYDRTFQKVEDIRAFVTTPEGKKLKYKSIQDLIPYSGYPSYSGSAVKIITMPGVVPGSVLDWQATIITKKPIIKNAFWDYFYFMSEEPVEQMRFVLTVPEDVPLKMMKRNTDITPVQERKGGKFTYTWSRPVEKFEPEEYMPPSDEFEQYVIISNIKDWQFIVDWYSDLVDRNLKASPEMKETVLKLIKGKDKEEDRIQAIIEYIQDNFRYVSMSFGYNNYEPHPSDEVFKDKYGDCKDQVILAIAMLREAGIKAYPLLFCDEDEGNPQDKLPAPVYFDHVILGVEVKGKIYYVDILLKGYRFNEQCTLLQGGYVCIIKPGSGVIFSQIPTLSESADATYKDSRVVIRGDGSAVVEIVSLWGKNLSNEMKERWKGMTEEEKQEFVESLDETHTAGGVMLERRWDNLEDRYERIKSFIKYEKPSWADVSGDYMTFGSGRYDRLDDFAVKKRKYPIMFWENSLHRSTNTYIIPKNFEILHQPKDINLKEEFADFSRTYKIEGRIISETEITRYKRMRLPVQDYAKIKDFYNKVAQLTNEKIIIKRKNKAR